VSGNFATGGGGGGAWEGGGGPGGNAFGGIYIDPLSTGGVTVTGSAVSNNTATGGAGGLSTGSIAGHPGAGGDATGGISEWSQTLSLEDSAVSGNTATGGTGGTGAIGPNGAEGGGAVAAGLALVAGSLRLERATISGNRATGGSGGGADGTTGGAGGTVSGGGLYLQGDATLVNVTIVGNAATAGAAGVPFGGGTTGPAGTSFGGGIDDQAGPAQHLTLSSATLASNTAGSGGNLWSGTTGVTLADTIVASGGAPAGPNCLPGAAITDGGHNLESTTPSQCGLSLAAHDVLGADPQLDTLAINGGATQTMALAPTSPARGAGGQCGDPTIGGQPLSADQRGQPRPNPCDIGAFQTEPPANTAPPTLTGSPVPRGTLTCGQGTWTGDAPLSFAVQWLRDGAPIAGALQSQYRVTGSDVGTQLSCRVSATNIYGHASQTSNTLTARRARFAGAALVATRLTVNSHGNVILKISCPADAGGGRCVDAIGLYTSTGSAPATISRTSRRGREATRLGRAHLTQRAGMTSRAHLHLNHSGTKLARKHASFHAELILTSHDSSTAGITRRYAVTVTRAGSRGRKPHRL
jgi:hypothetical protein